MVDYSSLPAPLAVQNEAPNVADRYVESLREPQLPSGFLSPISNGRTSSELQVISAEGSPLSGQFILYQIAECGSDVRYINLENV